MPSQSLSTPENTFVIDAVASASPSSKPTADTLAPSTLTRNTGKSAWIISEERSISRLTKPSAQTPRGIALMAARGSEPDVVVTFAPRRGVPIDR